MPLVADELSRDGITVGRIESGSGEGTEVGHTCIGERRGRTLL
jgi:hypothetical protein